MRFIRFSRNVEGRNINPEYSIEITADGKATWTGIHGVTHTGKKTVQLNSNELNYLNELCQKLQTTTLDENYCISESNRACASLEIEFNNGTKLTTYENLGRYRKDMNIETVENIVDIHIQEKLIDPALKNAVIELLNFEYQLDKLLNIERLVH